ncbi:sensor histidine kinase [Polyangium spumosum]|uniref:histidine kinase n=1 Tax=Polyangium spumosum TaxID=889282 RepID=A0A6N7PN70_9BACT|nr:PAS domain S-box protein [Polyangium spumosum]MRG91730.1 PAS domain S-box protein [Polyangium spumosum]
MTAPPTAARPPRAPRVVGVATACAAALGYLALLGWLLDIEHLMSVAPRYPRIVPVSAVGLILASLALWALGAPRRRSRVPHVLGVASAVAVVLLGFLTLTDYLLGQGLGVVLPFIEAAAFPRPFPGRPSPNTAVCFVLLGAALLLLPGQSRRALRFSQTFGMACALLALIPLAGYVFDAGFFYGMPPFLSFTGMALPTVLAFLALSAGVLACRPDRGVMSTLTVDAPGGVLLRRLLPPLLLLPLVLGRLFLEGEQRGLYEPRAAFSLVAVCSMVVVTSLLWVAATRMNRADEARRKAEESRMLLATVVEGSNDAIFSKDIDGTIQSWNPAATRLYGYRAEEVIGQPAEMLYPPERKAEAAEIRARVRRGERIEHHETVRLTRDGRRIEVEVTISPVWDASSELTGFSSIARDISGRKALEAEVSRAHEAERRLRAQLEAVILETARLYRDELNERQWLQGVLDQMPEAVLIVDAEGRIIRSNKAALAWMCSPPGACDPFGNTLRFDLRRPTGEPFEWEEDPLCRAVTRGERVQGLELSLRTAAGAEIPVLASAAPVRLEEHEDGGRVGAVMVLQDITALKELERLREQWTGVVAHDLRQPVQTILLSTRALSRRLGPEPPEDVSVALSRIRAGAARLGRMIEDLLDAARVEANQLVLDRRPLDLRTELQEIVERAAGHTEGHPVRVVIEGEVPAVSADRDRLEQIVTNLLSNAAKYGAPGSEIVIAARAERGEAEVAVTNRGSGIPAAHLGRLFQRFARLPGCAPGGAAGTGLGLYITKGLVEAHGGRVSVESTPGEVTTFRFTLPFVYTRHEGERGAEEAPPLHRSA